VALRGQGVRDLGAGRSAAFGEQDLAGVAGVVFGDGFGRQELELAAGLLAQAPFVHHHLQADERTHAGKQRQFVDRLGEEIVGAGLEAAHAVLGLGQGRHHDDGNVHGPRIRLQALADLEAVHAGHHDVQQDDVGRIGGDRVKRSRAAVGRHDVEVLGRKLGFQQPDVRRDIVDNQDARRHPITNPRRLLSFW
jgi:hypothetical protein